MKKVKLVLTFLFFSLFLCGHAMAFPGFGLKLPAGFYLVEKGDTLYRIAKNHQVSLEVLRKINQLETNLIHPQDILIIPEVGMAQISEPEASPVLSLNGFSQDDLLMLAKIIYAEARGESFEGQVGVGAVILNRLDSPGFPKSIYEIVMQNNGKVYQFSPVEDGSINLEPDDTAIKAALEAINGYDPTNGSLFFYNPQTATDSWIKTLPVEIQIGNHVFARSL